MRINENWEITSDELNVILRQRKIAEEKNGKPSHEYWVVEGYYVSPKAALKDMVTKGIMGTGMGDMQTICDKIDELQVMIDNLDGSYDG